MDCIEGFNRLKGINDSLTVRYKLYRKNYMIFRYVFGGSGYDGAIYLFNNKTNKIIRTGTIYDTSAAIDIENNNNKLFVYVRLNEKSPNQANPWVIDIK